jgi:hypothetical protein
MNCTAINSGDWNNPSVWQGSIVPGPNDDITINTGVLVTIDSSKMSYNGFGNLVQLGSLNNSSVMTVNGTLKVNVISNAGGAPQKTGICLYNDSKVIINSGGAINISATGYDNGATYNARGMSCSQNAKITNNGNIGISAHNLGGGIGFGIYLDDDGTQLNNYANISISQTDFEKDGRGHCYGLYISSGLLENSGTITSNATAKGFIKTDAGGTVRSTGSILNSGTVKNMGTINNLGVFTSCLPYANYQGNPISNSTNGQINIKGQLNSTTNLQNLVPVTPLSPVSIEFGDTLINNATFTIADGYSLLCKGTIKNNGSIVNNGTVIWDLGATFTPLNQQSLSYLIQGGTIQLQGSLSADLALNTVFYQSTLITLFDNIEINSGATLNLGNFGLTIPSTKNLSIVEGGIVEITQPIINNGILTINGNLKWHCSSQVSSPFSGTNPTGNGYVALLGSISESFDFQSISWPNFIIIEGDSLAISQPDFKFDASNLWIYGTLNLSSTAYIQTNVNNYGTINLCYNGDLRITSSGTLNNNMAEITGDPVYSRFVWDVAGQYVTFRPITGLTEFYLHGSSSSIDFPQLQNLSDSNTQFFIGDPAGTDETVQLQNLNISEGYKLNIITNLKIIGEFASDDAILRIDTSKSYTFGSLQISGIIGLFNSNPKNVGDNELKNLFPIFTNCTAFVVNSNDHLVIANDEIFGVNLTINGNVTVIQGKTLTIGNPAVGSPTLKVLGFVDNTGATLLVNNTQGVGLHFSGLNPAYNSGTINLSQGVAASIDQSRAAMYLERTLLNNSSGTITNSANGTPIDCNQGTICGGTFTPNLTPIGSPISGQTGTYVTNCS